jgi:RNA polymerase sigma-70 factor, ECF subfamily
MLNPDPALDAERVRRLSQGDRSALAAIYGAHKDRVYRFALAFCASRDLAADATQETFLALAEKPGNYDPGSGALAAYLCGVVRNVSRRLTRELTREDGLDESTEDVGVWQTAPSPLNCLLRHESARLVQQALRELPAHYREALILVELQDESYASASQILAVPVGTIRSRLSRGKALLAERLAALSDAAPSSTSKHTTHAVTPRQAP